MQADPPPTSRTLPPEAPAALRLRAEARALLELAWPLALSFTGNTLLGFVATALVGRVNATELAGVAIGNGLFFTVTIAAGAVVFGMDPLIAQALGAGEGARARATLKAGLRLALLLSVAATAVLIASTLALPFAGLEPAIVDAAKRYVWSRVPSTLPFVVLLALRGYLQARHVTRPIVLGMLAANLVNVVLSVPLVLGDRGLGWVGIAPLGLQEHGALGAGIAGTVATVAQLGVTALGLRYLEPALGEGDTRVGIATILRLGAPIGLTVLAEVGAFTATGVLAGRLGPAAVGGHQVAISLASLTFTASMAIGDATSVRVGRAVGRGDGPGARLAGFAGLACSGVWMSFTALVFLLFRAPIARLLSDRPDVLAVAVPLMGVAAAFQLFDGAQVVGAGALRGLGDTRPAQWANLIGYYLVGLPVAWLLAFRYELGAVGLWWGLSAGLAIVALTLVTRFERQSRKTVARAG